MTTRNVSVDARLKLEETLLTRWGAKHTDEVLRQIGYGDEEIARLREAQVI